jgi:xylan 1,4-beta-xylosidase
MPLVGMRLFYAAVGWIVVAGSLGSGHAQTTAPARDASTPIRISVDAARPAGTYTPVWGYFGADEPNYTYAPDGRRLLDELGAIDSVWPVTFRPHNLLTTGDGTGSLKWGSTNVYTEKADGTPVYDWTITDKIFDALRGAHVRPMVEIGFMPEALSPHPEPYRHDFPKAQGNTIFTGWAYPPKDEAKWRALIVAYVTHLRQRYGIAVDTWQWEVWNEPDIGYFHGTPEQYFRLYDITTGAIRQALPHAFVGGPASTGPGAKNTFLRAFLEHCAHGVNADTGKPGIPLDFISFHPKGSPKVVDGHVQMGLANQLQAMDRGMQIVASFPQFRHTPIILSETDPEGCAACKGPQNAYRNGALYGVSVAEMLARSAELARLRGVTLLGCVTWAFEFEDQPWFAGFRELATHGVDKPVLNVFRMEARLSGQRLAVTSSGEVPVAEIERSGVTAEPDVSAVATRNGDRVDVLLWNYDDADVSAPGAPLTVEVAGVGMRTVTVVQYRMDRDHSNAYTAWLGMGSPQQPTADQVAELRRVGGLHVMETQTVTPKREARGLGTVSVSTTLPRQGVALFELTW